MDRSRRKTTFGTGMTAKLGIHPVRLGLDMRTHREKSPLGTGKCGLTPSPTNLGQSFSRPRLGMRLTTGVTPIRPSDLSSRDASVYFSIKKSKSEKTPNKSPKTRRCLYNAGAQNNEAPSGRKSVAPLKPAAKNLRQPAIRTVSEKSRIPKPPSMKKPKPVTRSQTVVSSQGGSSYPKPVNSRKTLLVSTVSINAQPSTSEQTKAQADVLEAQQNVLKELQEGLQEQQTILQEQRVTLEEIKSIKFSVQEEQKSMLSEAKTVFSQIIQEQRSILEEQRKLLDEARSRSLSDHEFTADEKSIANLNTLDCRKENVPASETAYRQMRRSFKCLGTPTPGSSRKTRTPQIKTPRTSLSNKVRSQLQNLLDNS